MMGLKLRKKAKQPKVILEEIDKLATHEDMAELKAKLEKRDKETRLRLRLAALSPRQRRKLARIIARQREQNEQQK